MFNFHRSAIRSIKPQNLKVIGLSVLSAIMILILLFVSSKLIEEVMRNVEMTIMQAQIGGQSNGMGNIVIILIAAFILISLLWILIGYPIFSSLVYYISKSMKDESVKIRDVFSSFAKERYPKAVLTGLSALIIFILLLIIRGVVSFLYAKLRNAIFSHMTNSLQSSDHSQGFLITIQITDKVIASIISTVLMLFLFIIIINLTYSFVSDVKRSAGTNIKNAFRNIKNGHKTWFKFFIGLLLLWLIPIILNDIVAPLLGIATMHSSQKLALIIGSALNIISILIELVLIYLTLLAVTHYAHRHGERPTKD
ncbi:hypothetical protein N9R04_07780 [Staphylococcus sp. SQ8-PEA]|uniref:Lytic regulatory protein n=1 Tax=Staphylococcus marylandisciuri TaxID=2981529 RepID=A0ABT2QRN0_9STAP|nr:hypothetical protein [Staphylococcus marylandisciuri]MCU5746612.1 hypothetical protein [Staphylococcus marylandisciuri]